MVTQNMYKNQPILIGFKTWWSFFFFFYKRLQVCHCGVSFEVSYSQASLDMTVNFLLPKRCSNLSANQHHLCLHALMLPIKLTMN